MTKHLRQAGPSGEEGEYGRKEEGSEKKGNKSTKEEASSENGE